jgi:hypothetical protein
MVDFFESASTGVAWLSSARVVRCSLQWGNERNPRRMLNCSYETARVILGRKERTTSSQHGHYVQGNTHATMKPTMGRQAVRRSQSHQTASQWGLRAATRPHERGIGSNRESAISR